MIRKLPKDYNFKININQEISVYQVLNQAIEDKGIYEVFRMLGLITIDKGLPYVSTMMQFLAKEEDVDTVKGMFIIRYILDDWEKVSKKAMKHWKEKEKVKNENKTRIRK